MKRPGTTVTGGMAINAVASLFCLFILVSCTAPEKVPVSQEQLIRIASGRRYQTLLQRGTLRVAVNSKSGVFARVNSNGEFEGPEIERIKTAAKKAGLRLFLFDARPEAIAGYIRSGRADLAIGGLKPEEIRTMLLTPVMESKQGDTVYAFAAWEDAAELKELLEK